MVEKYNFSCEKTHIHTKKFKLMVGESFDIIISPRLFFAFDVGLYS